MNLKIQPVLPTGIDIVWPLVKEGLDRIERKGMAEEPQEVTRANLKGNPYNILFFVYDEKKYVGFFIARIIGQIHHAELCVYKAYRIPSDVQVSNEFNVQLNSIARSLKCKYITFYSTRKGWERLAEKYGFEKGWVQYTKEVKEE